LADFGFAKCVDNFKKDMLSSLVGTPLYMSPQILDNKKYTSKTDIWSIAFIFYESLFGKSIHPYQIKLPGQPDPPKIYLKISETNPSNSLEPTFLKKPKISSPDVYNMMRKIAIHGMNYIVIPFSKESSLISLNLPVS